MASALDYEAYPMPSDAFRQVYNSQEKAEFREGVKSAVTLYAARIAQLMDRGADMEVAAVLGATELDNETLASVIPGAMARDRMEFAKTGHEFSMTRQTCSLMIAAASLEREARGKGEGAAKQYAAPEDLERMRRVRREFKSVGRRATGTPRSEFPTWIVFMALGAIGAIVGIAAVGG